MSYPITGSSAKGASPLPQKTTPSVALHDKLARCVKQLGDWQGCPSGKTPEGQKIIDNLRAQIASLQSQIQGSSNDVAAPGAASGGSTNTGGLLDVYA